MIQTFHSAVVARKNASGGGGYDILDERFEGTGTPAGWSTAGTGTIDFDYAINPGDGTQSLLMSAVSQQPRVIAPYGSARTDIYLYCLLRINTLVGSNKEFFTFGDQTVEARTTGAWITRTSGSGGSLSVGTMAINTWYSVWIRARSVAGTNIISIGWSTTGIEPTSGNDFTTKTNGASTTAFSQMTMGWVGNETGAFQIDKLLVSTTPIGNNPA